MVAVSTVPLPDALALVQQAAFSYAIGNGDMHAKNISIGETLHGDFRLTPAYDMLSTIAYLPRDQLALPVEGRANRLRRKDFLAFATRLRVPDRAVNRVLDRICDAAPRWIERLAEIGFDDRVTARLDRELRHRVMDLA
jgi:serine/threonine-protein kinase HipA